MAHQVLALKGFFRFAVSRGHLDQIPLPTDCPSAPAIRPLHLLADELRCLLDAIPSCPDLPHGIEPETLRAILLLIYGAGLRRWGAQSVRRGRGLAEAILTVRDTKFFKTRLVPDRAGN